MRDDGNACGRRSLAPPQRTPNGGEEEDQDQHEGTAEDELAELFDAAEAADIAAAHAEHQKATAIAAEKTQAAAEATATHAANKARRQEEQIRDET